MSDVQIILPLDLFEGAESLTAEGIQAHLADAVKNRERARGAEQREKAMAQQLSSFGRNLKQILDEADEFNKLRFLRDLAAAAMDQSKFLEVKYEDANSNDR